MSSHLRLLVSASIDEEEGLDLLWAFLHEKYPTKLKLSSLQIAKQMVRRLHKPQHAACAAEEL